MAVLMTAAFASPGGMQLVNRNLARALSRRTDMECDFFSLQDTVPDRRYTGDRPFFGFGGQKARFTVAVLRAVLSRHYGLLLVNHVHLAPLALFWHAVMRRPYVMLTYGIEVWGRLPATARRALRRASAVLTISEYSRRRMCAANGLDPAGVEILPLCLDYFWEGAGPANAAGAAAAPTLLTVARALKSERYKGHDAVIRALPRIVEGCPGVRYVIVGDGDDYEWLQALARDAGVAGRVEFAGAQSDEALHRWYRSSTVFVMPSRGEGFGLVYLEAMHYRKPCIAGDCDAGQEIVRHGVNGFTVDPSDPDALAAATLRLLGDPALCASMGEAGQRLLETEFTFPRFAAVLNGTIDRVHAECEMRNAE